MPDVKTELFALGLYRSLTFIGIGLGVFLFQHGMNGRALWPIFVFLVGVFMTVKELMDMVQYTSMMNFVGVGVGILVLVLGIKGTLMTPGWVLLLGAFVACKEVMDLLHAD